MTDPQNNAPKPHHKVMAEVRHLVSKMRDDSTWAQLTPEQGEALDRWLFEEHLGDAKAVDRARVEFGVEGTISSMGRYYRRRARERQVEEFGDALDAAAELMDVPGHLPILREGVLKLLYKAVLKLATERPDEVQQFCSLTKLLLASEDNEIRRARLKLAERYFDYEATAACQKDLPQLRAFLKAISENPSLSDEERSERVYGVLYGWDKGNASAAEQANPKGNTPTTGLE